MPIAADTINEPNKTDTSLSVYANSAKKSNNLISRTIASTRPNINSLNNIFSAQRIEGLPPKNINSLQIAINSTFIDHPNDNNYLRTSYINRSDHKDMTEFNRPSREYSSSLLATQSGIYGNKLQKLELSPDVDNLNIKLNADLDVKIKLSSNTPINLEPNPSSYAEKQTNVFVNVNK